MSLLYFLLLNIFFASFAKAEVNLEISYGARLLAPSPEASFGVGYDLPAELIAVYNEETIKDSWTKFFNDVNTVRDAQTRREYMRDWVFIYQINQDAAKAWLELLNCTGDDAEQARQLYYRVDAKACPTAIAKIAEVHVVLSQYLKTTSITDPRNALFSFFSNKMRRDPNFIRMPTAHPLFMQVLLEETSAIFRLDPLDEKYEDPFLYILKLKQVAGLSDPEEIQKYHLDQLKAEDLQDPRALLNSLYMLESSPGKSCSEWGLWPAISRAIVRGFSQTQVRMGFDLFWGYSDPIARTQRTYEKVCGEERLYAFEKLGKDIKARENKFLHSKEVKFYYRSFRTLSKAYKDIFLQFENEAKNCKALCRK